MCNENLNTLIGLDFANVNDEGNWLHSSVNVLQTIDSQLVIDPDSATTGFVRQLGNLDTTNNRIRLKCNLEVEKTDINGSSDMTVIFQLMTAGNVLYESCAEFNGISDGINYAYFLDRVFKYDNPIATPLSLRIVVPDGWEHKVFLSDLVVEDYNFCEDNVRTYFVIDGLLEDSETAMAAGLKLTEWKIDGLETLTTDFFADTSVVGGNPQAQWLFAKANLDGQNRVSDDSTPNTFNPFKDEFKLDFDTVNSFHGGKPTATTSGANYGAGIMQIGLEKPAILNGNLNIKKGAFFIDIDYSKSLKIKFDVIVNQTSQDLFVRPTYIKSYVIEWNEKTCEKRFYYVDSKGVEVNEIQNGFLFGLTGVEINEEIVGCDEAFSPTGATGNFSYVLDFGTGTGNAGINYNAYGVPDRFVLEWNGQTYDSGFVGSNSYDQQLVNAGVNVSDINTASPSNGAGQLTFVKTSANPRTATITVLAPLGGTGWQVTGICPDDSQTGTLVEVGDGNCNTTPSSWDDVYIDSQDPSNYVPQNGDIIYQDAALSNPFNGGNDTFRMRVQTGPFQLILNYSFDISVTGVVSDVTICTTQGGGGNEIVINNDSVSNCYSCLTFTVTVPQGQTRDVEFNSNFAPSGGYGSNFCSPGPGSVSVSSDGTTNISQTTTFVVGIDGAQPAPLGSGTSTINITVKNNGVTTDSHVLSRTHANINC